MKDQRIKLITAELFIAWGLICWTVLLLDLKFWHLGMSPLYTSHVNTFDFPLYVRLLFLLLNISSAFTFCTVGVISDIGMKGELLIYVAFLPQSIFYWYMGNLTGRIIVRIKHFLDKTGKSVKTEIPSK